MSRRDRIDPETARLVEERLQWLLTENGPGQPTGTQRPVEQRQAKPSDKDAVQAESRRARIREPAVDPDENAAGKPDDGTPRVRQRRPRQSLAGVDQTPAAALVTAVGTFRRPHLVIVGTIVALGILLGGWAVLRARPVALAVTSPPVASRSAGTAEASAAVTTSPSPAAPPVVVHVLGAVQKPGLVRLDGGSRVQDALEAAGGLTGKADPGELNLAQQVADGQQIVVGTKGKPSGEVRDGSAGGGAASSEGSSAGGGSAGGGSAGGAGEPVNLNSANQAQLEELPGVGPVMAGKIIAWRTEHGRFSRVEELQEIDGVGPKTYAKLAPLCSV